MREIKFRAWANGRMIYCGRGGYGDFIIEQGAVSTKCEFSYSTISQNWPLMQYTGLKDKNGVEIYEGDIVRDHVGIGIVRWSVKNAAFRVSYGDGYAKWFYDYTLKGEFQSIEVIGKIHENPELLEA